MKIQIYSGRSMAAWQIVACTLLLFSMGAWSSAVAQVIFTRIDEGDITKPGYYYNCAWGDYDNDGFVDLMATLSMWTIHEGAPSVLYHNNGDGKLLRVRDAVIELDSPSSGASPMWGDYDNDGDLDLFISYMAGFGKMVRWLPEIFGGVPDMLKDRFYRNEGDGTFIRITEGAWVNDKGDPWGSGAAWVDYDLDGNLDLFVGSAHDQANLFYHNEGDGTMQSREGTITRGEWEAHGLTWTDYNNDRYPDLIISGQENMQFRNNGDGTFTPEGLYRPGGAIFTAMGVSAGDYDNDGDMDLAIAGWEQNVLYNNDGTGVFSVVMDGGITPANEFDSTSPSWADFDNDGYLDLYITNINRQNNLLYHNEGDGTFTRVTDLSPVMDGGDNWGAAWADYDNDGDLDLAVMDGEFYPEVGDPKPIILYRNDGGTNNWLILDLQGVVSNGSAIGAKVRIKAEVNGVDLNQLREVTSGMGCGSQNDLRVHFGLGDAAIVENLRIEWPSGAIQKMRNVAANQFLTIEEEYLGSAVANISTRGHAGTGDDILIAGLVITGNVPQRVLVRASGQTLADYGVSDVLTDTVLTVFTSEGTQIATNTDWGDAENATAIAAAIEKVGAFAFPADSTDSAVLMTLDPGGYTAQVRGNGGTTGNAIVEVYWVD